ncbi:MAG: hypothetical protein A3F78_07555 [Burkholderiales bacterium RIFCSPLOWO2_12_FULL_61_40]|nr:MAG: hypothetical protein A3F78_07555 [Burkholderiales bacterium RIFCSPLOWO2_12_FULL_61_40]
MLRAESAQASPDEAVRKEISRQRGVARVLSQTIFAGAQELEIEHNGTLYRLRKTSLGKLILTK